MFDGLDAVAFKPKDGKDRPGLYLEECSYQAAKYAVEHWHYSGCLPGAGQVHFGAWEEGSFVGTVIFSLPPAQKMSVTYGVEPDALMELSRVALSIHSYPTSRIVSTAMRLLRRTRPELRILVSYADEEQRHLGIIYQAMNWVYEGSRDTSSGSYLINGTLAHGKSCSNQFGTRSIASLRLLTGLSVEIARRRPKHKYAYPLDPVMRAQIEPLRKPYPKCVGSVAGGTVSFQEIGDGSIPIPTLHGLQKEEARAAAHRGAP